MLDVLLNSLKEEINILHLVKILNAINEMVNYLDEIHFKDKEMQKPCLDAVIMLIERLINQKSPQKP